MEKRKDNKHSTIISDVEELAAYIKDKYKTIYNKGISPLKLQKSLYFLFAYWGGFIMKGRNNPKMTEKDVSNTCQYLYKADIEAWVYGPVLPKVYRSKKIDTLDFKDIFLADPDAQDFVENLLPQIFKVSDFRLVDKSCADNVWKKYFNLNGSKHSNTMPLEEIIEEYARKV